MSEELRADLDAVRAAVREARERLEAGETVTLDHVEERVQRLADTAAGLTPETVDAHRERIDAVLASYQALQQDLQAELDRMKEQLGEQSQRRHAMRTYEQFQNSGYGRQTRRVQF